MNNLFVSIVLLIKLWNLNLNETKIVHIIKIKRKMFESKIDEKIQKILNKKKKIRKFESKLIELKTKYEIQIFWNELYETIFKNEKCFQFIWKNQQIILFMSNISFDKKIVIR